MERARLFIFVLFLSLSWWPKLVWAAATDHIVISEIQTGTATSSSQEFIELYNPTDHPVMLDGWLLQYHPAGATSNWTTRTSGGIHGIIPAQGFFLLAPSAYLSSADSALSSGMAAGGGSVQLVDSSANVVDLVGWGTGVEFEGAPAPAPTADGSLERLPGQTNPTGGNGIDTGSNIDDFAVRTQAEPQSSASPTETPGDAISQPSQPASNPGSTSQISDTLAPPSVLINELLIDPVAPKSDAKDEFIELYNPGATAVDLKGYGLKTGANFHDSYTLPSTVIPPGGYLSLYSSQTKLALTNSGGAAKLLNPSGDAIDQTADYDGSLPGLSFSRFGNDWQWTETLTPGAANVFVAPQSSDSAATNTSSSKKSSSSKSSSKSARTSKVKAPKAVKATKAGTIVASDQQKAGLNAKWLIIGLAAITLGYAIYEFRYDLQSYLVLARRNLATRRETRASAKRR